MANDFKPQMDGTTGTQPKKRRKGNANAANANAVNNTASELSSSDIKQWEIFL